MQEDRQPYFKDGVTATSCGTYAKFTSKTSEMRQVTVEVKNGNSVWSSPPVIKVDFDGQYHSDNEYNGYSYRSSIDDPYYFYFTPNGIYKVPSPTLQPTVIPSSRPAISPKPTTSPVKVYPTPTSNVEQSTASSKKVEELNKKVENLQSQLEASKQKQSVLEQRINDLVTFIKRIFPFFK